MATNKESENNDSLPQTVVTQGRKPETATMDNSSLKRPLTPTKQKSNINKPLHTLTPIQLYKMIQKQSHTALVLPVLLMSWGLPKSGKSDTIQKLLGLAVKPPQGFFHYEIIASELTSSFQCQRINDHDFHYYSFLPGFERNLYKESEHEGEFNKDDTTESGFKDITLECYTHKMLQRLQQTYKPPDDTETCNLGLKYIQKLTKGVGLIKVWDLPFNNITLQFLHCFSGHLYNSYMWLFVDAERDTNYLHKPPSTSEGTVNLRRSRLEHLVRSSKLCSHLETERKNACTIFAKHSGLDDQINEKLATLQTECEYAAPQLGVQSLINKKIIPFDLDKKDRSFFLMNLKHQVTRDPDNIPLSYVFLRGALDTHNSMFMKHNNLQIKAKECGIYDRECYNEFCRFFTSFGSILDVSLVNPNCDVVIIKPDEFLSILDRVLTITTTIPQEVKDMHKLLMDGIITDELAHTLFDEETDMFIEVLEAVGLLTNVTGRCSKEYADCKACFYMPSIKQTQEKSQYNPKAVQLMKSIRYPFINMEVAISKYLLSEAQNTSLQHSKISNVTKICFIEDDVEVPLIEIVYQGGVIEFLVESENADLVSLSVEMIVNGCQKISESNSQRYGESKYRFAVLCADEKHLLLPYNFSRKYHILPNDELCDICAQAGHLNNNLKAWNNVLQRKNAIPDNLKLTEDLTASDVQMLATEIAKFPDTAIKAFIDTLQASVLPLSLPKITLMNMITKWMVHHSNEPFTKKIMAKVLIKLNDQFKGKPESEKINFKLLARRLDLQTLTERQLENIEELLTEKASTLFIFAY